MNELVQQYWSRALKIARQYETGEVDFADLTGLGEEFAASFTEELTALPEPLRTNQCTGLETRLAGAIDANGTESGTGQAFSELLVSINRTPIY